MQQDAKFPSTLFRPLWPARTADPAERGRRRPASIWIRIVSTGFTATVWFYLASLLAVWMLIYFGGDRWWLATVLLFGPRWVCGLPLLIFVPVVAIGVPACGSRRLLWPLAAATAVAVFPVMGFCLPWAVLAGSSDSSIRVLTCNLKGNCSNNAALDELIADADPDIVSLQGCTASVRIAWPPGWHLSQQGELLVASRYPVREVKVASVLTGSGPAFAGPNVHYCIVSLPQRDIAFCSLHLPSPHYGLAESLDRRKLLSDRGSRLLDEESRDRRRQSEAAVEMAGEIHEPLILAGDFNMPADSAVYRETWGRFDNAFSRGGLGFGHTERPGSFGWLFGVRIDHILSDAHWRPFRCWVGPDVGSDHRPLVADLAWKPSGK